jgi:uncharacterized protein involved in oxidation of intracellular sulfur
MQTKEERKETLKMTEKILYIGTCAAENSEKAHMPFVLGNAALAMDIQATVVLQGNGVYLAKKGHMDMMPPGGGFPPISQLITTFLELGGKIKVCGPCIKERHIPESDLLEGTEITAAGALNIEAMESNAVFVY